MLEEQKTKRIDQATARAKVSRNRKTDSTKPIKIDFSSSSDGDDISDDESSDDSDSNVSGLDEITAEDIKAMMVVMQKMQKAKRVRQQSLAGYLNGELTLTSETYIPRFDHRC